MTDGVKARYEALIEQGQLHADAAQAAAIDQLDHLGAALDDYEIAPRKKSRLSRVFKRNEKRDAPMGLYLWGGVGRGKSMLMDLFYEMAPVSRKKRVHFHAFMQRIHDRLAHFRTSGESDPLGLVAGEVVDEAALLCFDELQITDITDAMIVGRLFERLFDAGVVVVTTSNRVPDDLYKDGLNRKLFLPFIELIKDKLAILQLDGDIDHRQERLEGRDLFFSPLGAASKAAVDAIWEELAGEGSEPLEIENMGRIIVLPAFSNGVARAGFDDLCAQPLGPSDYLAITKAISVLILEDIPQLSKARNNEAKRFVTLIDTAYEAGLTFIATAAAEPEALYVEGEGAFEFERTASRLAEMRSSGWADANKASPK